MKKKKHILSNVYMILINIFFFLPVITIIIGSINENKKNTSFDGLTFEWYSELLKDVSLIDSLEKTILLAVISTILSTMISTLVAFGMYRYKFKGKSLIDGMIYLPIIIPEIVIGISLMTIFSVFNIPGGLITLAIAHTTFCIPYVIFNVRASLSSFDLSLEEASLDLGAGKIETFFNITLPMILPGIKSGAFMAFTLSIDDVTISNFTNGPGYITLPIKVMGMTKRGVSPDVYALATCMMIVVIIIAMLSKIKIKKRSFR